MKKLIYTIILCATAFAPRLFAQMDVCMSVVDDRMIFYYTPEQDYNLLPNNLWNSQVITVRYPVGITVNWSDLITNTTLGFIEDPATIPAVDGGDGFQYKIFSTSDIGAMANFDNGVQTEVFSIEISASNDVTFEAITGVPWTMANNGEAAVNNAFLGNVFDEYTTSCGSQTYSAFCSQTPPFSYTCLCDGGILLDWDQFANGDSWTVEFEDGNGNPVLDFVNMPETQVVIAPGTLTNGECYAVAISENVGVSEVASITGPLIADCYSVPEISLTGAGPSCMDATDGEATITITEQGCMATYDVYLTQTGGADLLVGDDIMITGPIMVPGLGEGSYGVRLELVDPGSCSYGPGCFPLEINDLLLLENTDVTPPSKTVMDASGAEPPLVIDYPALPEGECGVQFTWAVSLDDNCLTAGVDLDATISTSSTNPSVTPSATVTVLNNSPSFAVEVHAAVGTNTLTLTATDANGNQTVMIYTVNVPDSRAPEIYGPGNMLVEIPSCEDGAPVNWTISVVDDCDLSPSLTQVSGPNPGDELNPGTYIVAYEAADDFGNTTDYNFDITVTQAASPEAVVDVSGNGNFEIPQCESSGLIVFSGNVYDCDLTAFNFNLADLSVTTTPLSPDASGSLVISYTLPQEGAVYFEASGNLTAGSYLVVTTYQGISVDHGIVITQDADTPAIIDMPGNLSYQAADCEAEVPVNFAVELSDDCDEDFSSVSFTLNGDPAPSFDAGESDPVEGLFVWNLNLSAGTYTLVASYTDGGGNVSMEEVTITVNGSDDDFAPIVVYPSQNINVDLDPCGPSTAPVVFEVTATDNCGGDITPDVSITGGTVELIGGNTYLAMVDAGGCQTVNITAQDAAGNVRTEDFQICVTQDTPPLAALICNDDVNVTLNDNCQREIRADMVLEGEFGCYSNEDFSITVIDDNPSNGNILDGCGEFVYEIEYNSGAAVYDGFEGAFAPGNWDVIEDAGGGDADVDFTSTTLTLSTLAGFDAIAMIPMPTDGTVSFDYEYNGADPNFDFFWVDLDGNRVIDITNASTGSFNETVDAGWMLVFHVFDDGFLPIGPNVPSTAVVSNFLFEGAGAASFPLDFEECWGYVTGEDKTDPVIECPPNTGTGTIVKNGYQISGTIDTGDPQVVVNDWSCLIDNTQPNFPGTRYVDVQPFQVDSDDIYSFLVQSDVTQTGNVGFAIYQGGYDIDNPCENIIAQADIPQAPGSGNPLPGSQGNDPFLRLALPLQAGVTYYLATTTFTPDATGNYEYSICADDEGQVGFFDTTFVTNPDWSVDKIVSFTPLPTLPVTLELRLHCEDFDAIYNNPNSLSITGSPVVSDNCSAVDVTFEDTYVQNGDCGDIVITRTFTATDAKGNTSSCVQMITLSNVVATNGGDTEVWLPPFTVPIECDEDYPTLANGNPAPEVSGYPFVYTVSGIFDLSEGQYCNVGASFEDGPAIVVCDGAFKFTRTWTIVDWCNPTAFFTYPQIIKVGDFTAPEVICPGEDYDWDGTLDPLVFSTSPFACTAGFEVPLPTVTDNCSSYEVYTEIVTEVEVDVVNQYGQVTGTTLDTVTVRVIEQDAATRIVSGIPQGDHYFYYMVEDDCGNKTEVYCPFSVEDQIEPTAVCDDELNVSIAGGNYARIYAEDIDEGSWDNCGIASIEVRRNQFDPINFTCGNSFSLWGDYVDFFCCDAGDTITIELRVTDLDGNENTCWLDIVPEEKVNPYCEAPHAETVDCTDLPYDFDPFDTDQLQELFGMATATDNCAGATAEELPPVVDLECGFGRIIRRFRATDAAGNQSVNFCQQIVDIEEVHNYEIRFPADAEAVCGVAEPDSVTYEELACDLLAVSHTDEFFEASGNECYKIFRKWKVINWCQYDGEGDPLVIGRDEDCDGAPGDEAVWALHRPDGYTYIDRDNDETEPNNVPLAFQNICQGFDDFWRKQAYDGGFYEYTQIIKVYDDIDPIITFEEQTFCSYDNEDCDGVVNYPFVVDENCTPDDLTIKVFLDAGADGTIDANLTETGAFGFTLEGTYPDYTITGEYPIGCHIFEVHVEDGCGNVDAEELPFCVEDCKSPSPVCINGLAIELMPFDVDGDDVPDEGRMAIWASDFVASPVFDCTGPVVYSMNRSGEPANIDSSGIVLTCADTGTLVVEIWAWDGAGNSDFCETYILVQDNMGSCGTPSPGIAGTVETEEAEGVEGVTVSLSGQGTATQMTSADGSYSFTGLVEGYDYTITPERDGDYLNGVSTFDLVLISQHILGVQPLDSPYKRIAADANNSESITTLDLIALRKLILSIDLELPNNSSWRFVEADYVFPQPTNPWQENFPELANINDLPEAGLSGVNFIAVKIGDVNGDAEVNSLQEIEERSFDATLALEAEEVLMKVGKEYTIEFSINDLEAILGYQATLEFNTDAVELVDIIAGEATEANFGFSYLDEGIVMTSWNSEGENFTRQSGSDDGQKSEENVAPAASTMFSLVLRATAHANLSEVLGISSRITKAEAYGADGSFQDMALAFHHGENIVKRAQFELYQNQPNPFRAETLIGFNLPEAATVTLTITDVQGRVVKLIRLDGVKGYNSVVLNADNLPKGVLQYNVSAGQYTGTRTMVITE